MNNLFLILVLLSFPVMFYFVIRMLISYFKKNSPHMKKMLKLFGVTFGVMVISFIAFFVTIDPATKEQAKINIEERKEAEKLAVLAQEKADEEAKAQAEKEAAEAEKVEEEEKIASEAKKKEDNAAAELKAKQDAEAKAKADAEQKVKEETEPVDKVEKEITTTEKVKSKIESAAKDSIHNHFGKTSNIDKRKNIIDVTFDEETGLLTTIVLGNDNLSTKFIVGGMHKAVAGVAQDMKDESEVKELMMFVQFPLVDAYGNEKDGDVMRVNLTRSTLDKINFENFDYNKVPDIADSYFLHKALQ